VLAAEREGLPMRDVVDERSAAFVALGRARAGALTACLCTSGTAPAHWFPAVIEASEARVPLLLLSADRPLELSDCAAPQTIQQMNLFGGHVRHFAELGLPDFDLDAARGLRRRVAQAVALSVGPPAGPVHLNVRFRKPLEPHLAHSDEEAQSRALRTLREEPFPRRWAPAAALCSEATAQLTEVFGRRRGVFVAGPASPAQAGARDAILALARRIGWPIVADSTSQLRFGPSHGAVIVDAGEQIARAAPRLALEPEVVVQLGAPPTSSIWQVVPRLVIAPDGWPDPGQRASMLAADAETVARTFLDENLTPPARTEWAALWARANDAAMTATDGVLGDAGLCEATVARAALAALPRDGLFFVGNSLSIRHLDAYAAAGTVPVGVLCQRGANGIDGLISGAAGAASTGRPVTLLVGDVSLLHDVGGLWAARDAGDLDLVVVDNGGGRIFEQLALGGVASATTMSHFVTPPRLQLSSLAQAFGLDFASVADRVELGEVLKRRTGRTRLVEVRVEPNNARRIDHAVTTAVDRALDMAGFGR